MEIQSTAAFLRYYENIRARTSRVAARIPPDRIEWTHQDGKFTLGDIIRHLAGTERYMFGENVQGNPSRYPGHGRALADGYEAVMAYFDDLHAQSMEIFGALDEGALRRKCITPAGVALTTWKWLRAMVEHEVHHRGQLYLMLGMLGVATPPLYGLTAEEVLERSAPS